MPETQESLSMIEKMIADAKDNRNAALNLMRSYWRGNRQAKEALIVLLSSATKYTIKAIAYYSLLRGPDYLKEDCIMEILSSFKKNPDNKDGIGDIISLMTIPCLTCINGDLSSCSCSNH
ncbi:MAG: hypothetical protein PHP35_00545 [Candidatus Colwellbacteria bacterium]|nr:hypothetical protein [Candidatus Colwellbacteria bacterium]